MNKKSVVIKIIEILYLIALSILLGMVLAYYFDGNHEKSIKIMIITYFLLSLEKFFDNRLKKALKSPIELENTSRGDIRCDGKDVTDEVLKAAFIWFVHKSLSGCNVKIGVPNMGTLTYKANEEIKEVEK